MLQTLGKFLGDHRCKKDEVSTMTGMGGGDKGSYHVNDEEYDTFLKLLHNQIWGVGQKALASNLIERCREPQHACRPLLVDLDFRYELGAPLNRHFTGEDIQQFIAEYIATMVYFYKIEDLPDDLIFWHLEKPSPVKDKGEHKDGVHIQCANLTTNSKFQFGIRGFMLQQNIIQRLFGDHGMKNSVEDCYDVSVLKSNGWFFYGASKPDMAQYKLIRGWRVLIADLKDALDGGDPALFTELPEIVQGMMTEVAPPKDNLEVMKMLSVRRNHKAVTPLEIRDIRKDEWEELMINWGSGKATAANAAGTIQHVVEQPKEADPENQLVVTDTEDGTRVTNPVSDDDVKLCYRLFKECINPEKRAGEYQDWVNCAILLKNVANNDESYAAWVDLTRRVGNGHKKSSYPESQLRTKWNLIRVDESRKLGMGSLQHWSKQDNKDKYDSILSETLIRWIVNLGRDTHVSIASFVCMMYKQEFRCSYGKTRNNEWYQYPVLAHSWKAMKTPTELRARLSNAVRGQYWEAEKEAGNKANTQGGAEKSTESDIWSDKKKKIAAIQVKLETTTFKDCVLRECQEKFYDDEFIAKLNSNPYILGVANGVLDLRHHDENGKPCVLFRDGVPEDNISFQMGRNDPDMEAIPFEIFNPQAPTETQRQILEFFERIYPDPILREYVMTLLASCLEGTNKEQRFYVMQGKGSNGKSMIEMLMELTFGDYGTAISTTVFTRKKPDSGSANPDIITIKCRRYIHTGEPDDNEKINTAIMKQYTGGDRVAARGLYGDQDKFSITGKIFMSCNDLPPVSKTDNGTWRRIRVIPHISTFKDPGDPAINPAQHIYEKDLDLENKLRHWRTAFLGILVWYYQEHYLAHGLKEPPSVTAASDKYKQESDMFLGFIGETFVVEPDAGPVSVKDFRMLFTAWKKVQGKACDMNVQQAVERMKEFCKKNSNANEFWGVRIAEDGEDISGGGPAALLLQMP
jgi:P4 family phage/plasmid primase-like protien